MCSADFNDGVGRRRRFSTAGITMPGELNSMSDWSGMPPDCRAA
jgi:hypothetical protein